MPTKFVQVAPGVFRNPAISCVAASDGRTLVHPETKTMSKKTLEIVTEIVGLMGKLGKTEVANALHTLGQKDATYGLLWGNLDPARRRQDDKLLKLMDIEKDILLLIQDLQNNQEKWAVVCRVTLQHTVDSVKAEEPSELEP